MKQTLAILVAIALCLALAAAAHAAQASRPVDGEYDLADFGSVKTASEAEATFTAAIDTILAKGGGVLAIAPGVAPDWIVHNDAPSSTRPDVPSVTVVDRRNGYERIILPSNGRLSGQVWSGRSIVREVRQPIDMAQGVHSTETIDTYIAGGTSSYYQPILSDVKAGANARIYVPTIRGLAVGNHIVLTGAAGTFVEPNESGPIKRLGWDEGTRQAFIVMEIDHDHPKGALLYDKHVVNSLSVTDHSQSDNQSMSLMVARKNYGQGDSFVISASARSMSNVMSAGGDEGGLTYASDISNDLQPFRSTVESVNWDERELVYAAGNVRNHTLGTSRPIINMMASKHLTSGRVFVVAPGYNDPWLPGAALLTHGAIIGSKDCGWTQEVVGRFFAVDEPSEYLDPKNDAAAGYTPPPDMRVHRWYLIQKLEARSDGTQRLYVERTRWLSSPDHVPKLYDFENYTHDQHQPPLRYIIAPGAYVADVSRAWTNAEVQGGIVAASAPRTLLLAPSSDIGSRFDFEKGDRIVQAIGQDPWNVTGMRVRHFNYVPSTIEDSTFQSVNAGRVAVDSALAIYAGSGGDLAQAVRESKDRSPQFLKGIDIAATTATGIRFGGDVRDAAIRFEQPHSRPQPIQWLVRGGSSSASLTVDPQTGEFALRGGATHVDGLMLGGASGISGGPNPAHNLRGIRVPVRSGSTELTVQFPQPEVDANYALHVQPSWFTAATVVKLATGFTARFEKAAPDGGAADWILVR